jgi:hypothetical protein
MFPNTIEDILVFKAQARESAVLFGFATHHLEGLAVSEGRVGYRADGFGREVSLP